MLEGRGGRHPFRDAADAMLDLLESTLTLDAAEGRMGQHRNGGEGGETGESKMRRRRRGLFTALLCSARGTGTPPLTRDDAALCRGCLLPARNPSAAGDASAPRTSSETTEGAVGAGEGIYPRIRVN